MRIRKQQKAKLFADICCINGKIILELTSCNVFLYLQSKQHRNNNKNTQQSRTVNLLMLCQLYHVVYTNKTRRIPIFSSTPITVTANTQSVLQHTVLTFLCTNSVPCPASVGAYCIAMSAIGPLINGCPGNITAPPGCPI